MSNSSAEIKWLAANWHAPANIHAGSSLRDGGVSSPPYNQLNLGMHVADDDKNVLVNRARLAKFLNLPAEPFWLNQIHGNHVLQLKPGITDHTADGCYSTMANTVCVVMTADCLPLLLCDMDGSQIAAIHIGWRGFSDNIISHALDRFTCPRADILAWLGPCISAGHYEIDATVYHASKKQFAGANECFTETRAGHWLMDLKQLVARQLKILQVGHVYTSPRCTYSEQACFFSHRRDGITGRMATLIWMDSQTGVD